MSEKKDKLNRRDFLSAGMGALAGASFFGIGQGEKQIPEHQDPDRSPAGSANRDKRDMANDYKDMKAHYPFLIIGSGYGGSVLAARLSEQGKKVCVLERGKEWHPGMFPGDPRAVNKAARSKVNPRGLVDSNLHLKSDVDIICASGLGGTSLLNAAISTRPEALVWQQKEWPKAIREDFERGHITAYMDRAEGILGATNHPDAMNLKKTKFHEKAVKQLGLPFNQLRLNVNHKGKKGHLNDFGKPQSPCTLCGDCCSGCNVGAKNVLTVNYLPLAKSHGAEIYTTIEVTYIEKDKSGKYIVHYTTHPGFPRLPHKGTVSADNLILAAGSMGTTQIMMKSKMKGLRLSSALGTRFSANGDVLGFSYNGLEQTDMVGTNGVLRPGSAPGQAIMVYADYRHPYTDPSKVDLMERYLLLDGTIPTGMGPIVAKGLAAYALSHPKKFTKEQLQKARIDLYDTHEPDMNGALNSSLIFFACGHDTSDGRYKLDHFNDRVHVKWPNVVNEKGFQAINREMAKYAKIHGGVYIPNPRMAVFGHRMMATHPLGGCPMGEDAQDGVVDHLGRVFQEDGRLHEGLYIVDAAIIPRSLGATPLITIAALAERIADHINEF